jgi:nitronate monooxygenase
MRALRNETTATVVRAIESQNAEVTNQDQMPIVAGKIGPEAYVGGDWSKGLQAAGHALAHRQD